MSTPNAYRVVEDTTAFEVTTYRWTCAKCKTMGPYEMTYNLASAQLRAHANEHNANNPQYESSTRPSRWSKANKRSKITRRGNY